MMYNVDDKKIEQCLKEIKSGNTSSLEELYTLTKNNVYNFSLLLLKNKSDAEDVMQDTYVNIYKYAKLYDPRNKPLAWILTIAKNLSYTKIKKRKKDISFDNINIDLFLSTNNIEKVNDKLLIKSLLTALNDEERYIIVLHIQDELKFSEISKLLELKLSTVLSKYNRAIKKLRSSNAKEMRS